MAGRVADYLRLIMHNEDPRRCLFVDGTYVWFRRAHPEVVTVFSKEQLGFQRPSRTDLHELKFFDKVPGCKSLAGIARKLRAVLLQRRKRVSRLTRRVKTTTWVGAEPVGKKFRDVYVIELRRAATETGSMCRL